MINLKPFARRPVIFWCLLFLSISVLHPAFAGGDGTLLILSNPTNSSPRIVSLWGGASSEQIIMKSDGSVWDWGYNGDGQLGNGTTNNADLPQQVLGPNGVGYFGPAAAIMGGEIHNFALKPDGTVWAWGWNYFGQLGDGSTNWGGFNNWSTTPVQVFGLTSVKSLGGRGYHSLALKTDGTVWDWGCNRYGELGIGVSYNVGNNGFNQGTNTPVQVLGLTNPAALSGGGFFSLALMSNGTVQAWGEGSSGECGNGTNLNCTLPVPVSGLSNVVAISAGWFHALALRADGTVWAWGGNPNGEIGDNTTSNRYAPVEVIGLSNMVAISTGDGNSLARRADGTIWKWGENNYGEQGIGTSDANPHPLAVPVPGFSNVVLSANRDYHNICVKQDGTAWVWGDNRSGGEGDFSGVNVPSPRQMPGLVSNNLLPYAESFETYAGGTSLAGTNYWSSDSASAAVITTTNYAPSYNGLPPIAGTHQNLLQINGTITNHFLPSFETNVWVDMIVQANPPTNPANPPTAVLAGASFAFGITSNGQFEVWNRTNPPATGNGWTTLLDTPPATNQFCRLTIQANYAPDTNGIFYYRVWVNGIASTSPATWYAAADSSQPWLGQLIASGNFQMDDLVISTNKSFYALQTTVAGYGGAISPDGPLIVAPGTTDTFTLTTSNWYNQTSVVVDGNNFGSPASYTFTNVFTDHTLTASYAAQLAANNTPKWWLYSFNSNWATNFDAAALGVQNGTGLPAWQAYIAGLNPTNPASLFTLSIATANGQTIVSQPTVATTPQNQTNRYYALEITTNLTSASWQGIPGNTNLPGLGQTITCTNQSTCPHQFFRSRVWLGP